MTIRFVTDSACDLPKAVIEQYDICVVPLFINIGNVSYQDGVDLSREDFYQNLPDYHPAPKTAAPGPAQFQAAYDKLVDEGASAIISIHISESLSNTIEAARLGAKDFTRVPVTVIDSQQLSLGVGLLVVTAAQAAAEGKSVEEIVTIVEEKSQRTYTFAALDTLEYLRRGGRMSLAVASLGEILRIKPVLKMNKGEATAERVRTTRRAVERLIELISDIQPLDELYLVHTFAPDKMDILREKAAPLYHVEGDLLDVSVTPVLGAHLGPGTYGFSCVACATDACQPHSMTENLIRLAKNIRG
jgi:fatty acid kinase fatty acid binding subunit